jgi:hypothetical protein
VCTDKDPDLSIAAPCENGKQQPIIIVRDGDTEAPTVTDIHDQAARFGDAAGIGVRRVLVYGMFVTAAASTGGPGIQP